MFRRKQCVCECVFNYMCVLAEDAVVGFVKNIALG